jgi:hypothetical protein
MISEILSVLLIPIVGIDSDIAAIIGVLARRVKRD